MDQPDDDHLVHTIADRVTDQLDSDHTTTDSVADHLDNDDNRHCNRPTRQ